MRDPNRIKEILNRLANAWRMNPDLRLGQLISNALPDHYNNDPFLIEDEDLILRVEDNAFVSRSEARRVNRQRKPIVE